MNSSIPDPIRHAAQLIAPEAPDALEERIKRDIFQSIARIKPDVTKDIDFSAEVMSGQFFEQLSPPLQGIAIARTEGVLAFYNRVGWAPAYLETALESCVPADGLEPLQQRYHANTLHDLAYVHPKHFVKMLGKAEAASLWETLKRFTADAN
ncbi:hypothetical protein [Granulosicoccus antarcticus]|uniref:Uncharacterized protein n=1 Tax=Granulosicoccus antarcticus IMCC3135 TaxID=1192854 RepID=A0A2Z2NXS9_9GAMM|nr:hypothetical protein [Granulosicoccus antarcticus]ASJ76252.1 hypothetical protein IMCC3135_31015 [Granulosicoccus antarcticus IMCC3135]